MELDTQLLSFHQLSLFPKRGKKNLCLRTQLEHSPYYPVGIVNAIWYATRRYITSLSFTYKSPDFANQVVTAGVWFGNPSTR